MEDLGVLPIQMRERLYQGMLEELQQRGKSVVTAEDEESMKVRWIKQSLHRELDQTRALRSVSDDVAVMDLEIEGALIEGEQLSITAEAEKEAAKVLKQACGTVQMEPCQSPLCMQSTYELDYPDEWRSDNEDYQED